MNTVSKCTIGDFLRRLRDTARTNRHVTVTIYHHSLTHDRPPLILLPSLLHRQYLGPKRPPNRPQPILIRRILGQMHIPPLIPDPVYGSDDHGRADTEHFKERPVCVPPLEVGHGDPAFGGIEGRPEGRVEIRIGEEGETRGACDTGENRPVQPGSDHVPPYVARFQFTLSVTGILLYTHSKAAWGLPVLFEVTRICTPGPSARLRTAKTFIAPPSVTHFSSPYSQSIWS